MLRTDTVLSGVLTGVAIFFLFSQALRFLNTLFANSFDGFSGVREQFIYMVAAVALLIPFQIFIRQDRYNSLRGVVLVTILAVFGILYFFRESIFR